MNNHLWNNYWMTARTWKMNREQAQAILYYEVISSSFIWNYIWKLQNKDLTLYKLFSSVIYFIYDISDLRMFILDMSFFHWFRTKPDKCHNNLHLDFPKNNALLKGCYWEVCVHFITCLMRWIHNICVIYMKVKQILFIFSIFVYWGMKKGNKLHKK